MYSGKDVDQKHKMYIIKYQSIFVYHWLNMIIIMLGRNLE